MRECLKNRRILWFGDLGRIEENNWPWKCCMFEFEMLNVDSLAK